MRIIVQDGCVYICIYVYIYILIYVVYMCMYIITQHDIVLYNIT